MTPKEKAEDLLLKYSILKDGHNDLVKQCALIAAKEISDIIENMSWIKNEEYFIKANFWEDVKKEINKI
jgi:hypothetical protein